MSWLEEIAARIAGEIVTSDIPGLSMKKWRECLRIKQIELSKQLSLSPSVLSDYEAGRRNSPGTLFVKKYVRALIELDTKNLKLLRKLSSDYINEAILCAGEYKTPIPASRVLEALECKILAEKRSEKENVYGYTVLDCVKAIAALSGFDYVKIFGLNTERALVFVKVGQGRLPILAVRASQIKPKLAIVHEPHVIDQVAVEIAKKEGITFALTHINEKLLLKRLAELAPTDEVMCNKPPTPLFPYSP